MKHMHTNVYILAPENEFPEIIYAFFGGKQNIFSTFGTKYVFNMCSKNFENQLTNKDFMLKINFE